MAIDGQNPSVESLPNLELVERLGSLASIFFWCQVTSSTLRYTQGSPERAHYSARSNGLDAALFFITVPMPSVYVADFIVKQKTLLTLASRVGNLYSILRHLLATGLSVFALG